MFDISAVGSQVIIKTRHDKIGTINITHFSDEGTPFECPDVDFSTNQKNLNGDMISSRTPSVYTVSVTVIPGSKEDQQLTMFAQANALQPSNVVKVSQLFVESIMLLIPEINLSAEDPSARMCYQWFNGRLKSGPTGMSTSVEGRLSSRTFVFELEKFMPPSGGGDDIEQLQHGVGPYRP